jgi:hypothetical protein
MLLFVESFEIGLAFIVVPKQLMIYLFSKCSFHMLKGLSKGNRIWTSTMMPLMVPTGNMRKSCNLLHGLTK